MEYYSESSPSQDPTHCVMVTCHFCSRSADSKEKVAVIKGESTDAGKQDSKAGGDSGLSSEADSQDVDKKSSDIPGEAAQSMDGSKTILGNGEGQIIQKEGSNKEEEGGRQGEEGEEEEVIVTLDGIQLLFDIEAAELIPLIIRWVLYVSFFECCYKL